MHVLIIGGGPGGLCLAHGLRQRGVDVALFERGRDAHDWPEGAFRIHINATGSQALHACLPPAVWGAFDAAAGQPAAGLAFSSRQLREWLFVPDHTLCHPQPERRPHPIGRLRLRQVLLQQLEDTIRYGKRFVRCEPAPDGRVTAHFADGTSVTGDVLVGADGAHSAVRQQLWPDVRTVDTGLFGINGKLPLTDAARGWLPRAFVTRLNLVLPLEHAVLFVAPYLNGTTPDPQLPDHVFWAIIAPRHRYGPELEQVTGPDQLHRLVERRLVGWHPDLRRLVAESPPALTGSLPITTGRPFTLGSRGQAPVTLLGDAVHPMTPLQGLGGNTALRDASLLCRRLVDVQQGQSGLSEALRGYERELVDYGFRAQQVSLRVAQVSVAGGLVARTGFRVLAHVARLIPSVRERVFPLDSPP